MRGIGGHHSGRPRTVEWLSPPELLAELLAVMGRRYAVDPCAAISQPWPTAARMINRLEDGLATAWDGDAFVNPPYTTGDVEKWLARLAEHGDGMAVIFARTETEAFFEHVWDQASAVKFLRGRLHFHYGEPFVDEKTGRRFEVGERAPANAGGPTVLCAYGDEQRDVLAAASLAGKFIPLRFPRWVLGSLISVARQETWDEALAAFFATRDGPVRLEDLYAAFASHPKAENNPHYRQKLRQRLQVGPYARVQPGLWDRAP